MSALPSRREGVVGSRFQRFFGPARLIVALAVLGVLVRLLWPVFFPPPPEIRTAMIVEEIRTAAKLATVELQATVVGNRDESTWYGSKFLFMIVPGKAAVGVDLEGLSDDAIRVSEGKVTVTLPKPRVLYTDVNLQEVQVYSSVGLLRPQFTPEETRLLLAESQQKLVTKANQEAVLKRAETQTADLIRRLLVAAGAKEVTIDWAS